MVNRKRKYESGAATNFISRKGALKKLQITLPDFRRLCIMKGVYPHEPRNKKNAGKGSTVPRTFYLAKDIRYLLHEPVLRKFRQFKSFIKKVNKAKNRRDFERAGRLSNRKPRYTLDHIVKERYPTFLDAVRDLDDCLSMCCLFGTFPRLPSTSYQFIEHCKQLSVEFMHYVIASKSLRKVFVSIKGIYLQAEIMGENVTWVIPHKMGFQKPRDVDFRIMSTFVDFYTTMLGFVNYKLYNSLGLHYPPKLKMAGQNADEEDEKNEKDATARSMLREVKQERLSALTQSLVTAFSKAEEQEMQLDTFPVEGDDPDRIEQAKLEAEKLQAFQNLFHRLKFFLGREVPRETLTFCVRSFGGQVSWDSTVAIGYSYPETDESITHQIVDRPEISNQYLSRYYVQPQWVFDCINARRLLPVEDYFPGAVLPPHLSPFVEEQEGDYMPPEKKALLGLRQENRAPDDASESESELESEPDSDEGRETGEEDEDDGEDREEEEILEAEERHTARLRKRYLDEQEEEGEGGEEAEGDAKAPESGEEDEEEEGMEECADSEVEGEEEEDEEGPPSTKRSNQEDKEARKEKMAVRTGKPLRDDREQQLKREQAEERRLGEMMIPKKKRNLYNKIVYSRKRKARETRVLEEKREQYEKEQRREQRKRHKQAS